MKIETKFNIACAVLVFVVFLLALCASAVTADWDAVKRLVGDATNDTLRAANAYADQHGGGSGGGADEGTVRRIVDQSFVGGTNAVKAAVAAVGSKADRSDLDGYLPLTGGQLSGNLIGFGASLANGCLWTGAGTIYPYSGPDVSGPPMIYNSNGNFMLWHSEAVPDNPKWYYGDQASDDREVAVKGDIPDVEPLEADIRSAYQYSRAVSLYMTGNTNAWFAGTNYVFGSDAATRRRFAWESGMDAATVPCSMALWENRDGVKQCVWDQRDWPTWYWSFKAAQMRSEFNASNAVLRADVNAAINSDEAHAWAKRYAATGRVNPDASTTFIDTPSVCLSPGMSWETVATVGGCGYWTIVGNGAVIGGSGTNAVLDIKDFEGNSILQIAKGEHRLAWLSSADFVSQMTDADGWVCFDMRADVQPTGYFSTTLDSADFVAGSDADCPAQYSWENRGDGVWRVHFLLKPGIVSNACFAKFQVEVEGKTQIRYNADTVINGGLIYNGVKIAPVIPSGAGVGSPVTWKVVE